MDKIMIKITEKKAVTMVETVAILPFIVIIIGVMISCGQMISNKMLLNYAVETAARAAAQGKDKNEVESIAKNTMHNIVERNWKRDDNGGFAKVPYITWQDDNTFTCGMGITVKTLFPIIGIDSGSETINTCSVKSEITMKKEQKTKGFDTNETPITGPTIETKRN